MNKRISNNCILYTNYSYRFNISTLIKAHNKSIKIIQNQLKLKY